MMERHLK